MNTKEKLNIIWVVTDSARNFSTGGLDDRDRPDYYDNLLPEFVSFDQAVTSAPSSVMSGSTMLTGLSSYFIGRNYDDFRYEKGVFTTLPELLAERGYINKGIFVAREMRDKIAPFIGHIENKYWPEGLKHASKMWGNDEANLVLDNYLAAHDKEKPLFLMHWNNIRHDDKISENLAELERILRKHEFWDNSIIIYCADHGYPHPRRGFTPEGLKRQGLTHDLILTDDNILIPLFIKTPDVNPRSVNHVVGTVDLFPTILDYLNIDIQIKNFDRLPGKSLREILSGAETESNDEARYIRSDSRFFGQSDRRTAIRSQNYKYVYFHDECKEEFYDLRKDPGEDNDMFNADFAETELFQKHKAWFDFEEQSAIDFQKQYSYKKLKKTLSKYPNGVVLLSLHEQSMNDSTVNMLFNDSPDQLHYFIGKIDSNVISNDKYIGETVNDLDSSKLDTIKNVVAKGAKLIILVVSLKSDEATEIDSWAEAKGLKKEVTLDINFSSSEKIKWTPARIWKALASRKDQIIAEPTVLLTYGKQLVRVLTKGR